MMSQSSFAAGQRGAVMIVTLLFLVILTMLGIAAMTGSTMEERMAGNTRDSVIALQAAEAALRDARRDINDQPMVKGGSKRGTVPVTPADFFAVTGSDTAAPGTCSSIDTFKGLCRPANNPDGSEYSRAPGTVLPNVPTTHSFKKAPSLAYGEITGYPALGGENKLSALPRYLVEVFCVRMRDSSISQPPSCNFYRVTAAGYGRNPNTVVSVQEIFVGDD